MPYSFVPSVGKILLKNQLSSLAIIRYMVYNVNSE
nr:MAG TPA: hypothetical protein [Caudoviricetes sp.]